MDIHKVFEDPRVVMIEEDLHLVYPFYWLYKCVKIFSLYDLIYVRDFRFEIEICCWDEFQQSSQ